MKVVLVNPPNSSVFETQQFLELNTPPLGLGYVGAVLERDGFDVMIIDALATLKSQKDVIKELRRIKPDLVGVTSMTPNIGDAVSLITSIKENMPEVVTVLGGNHITFLPKETMFACPALDIGVMGEGEMTMLELARRLEDGRDLNDVEGTIIRKEGKIRQNPPRKLIEKLDDLPFPARHLLPMERYSVLGLNNSIGNIITSRGCPFKCIFCSSSKLFSNTYRWRSAENVCEEIEELQDKYKVNFVGFVDDTFTLNKKRSFNIARLLRKLDISWAFGSRVDTITEELLRIFKQAGAVMFYMGIESASDKVLKFLRKGITVEQTRAAIRCARKSGIETTGSFIIGTPGETIDDAMETIRFAASAGLDFAQFTAMTPYPGTEIYEIAKKEGFLESDDWSQYTTIKPVMHTEELTSKQIKALISKAYRVFYVRPRFLIDQIAKRRAVFLKPVLKRYLLQKKLR